MIKSEVKQSRIKQLRFGKCNAHQNQEVNQTCVQDGCIFQFQPACMMCEDEKEYSCKQHRIRQIKSVLLELDDLTSTHISSQHIDTTSYCLENEIDLLANQYKNIATKCLEISDNIILSSNKFKKTYTSLAPEVKAIQHIIDNISGDCSTKSLRINLLQVKKYVTVDDDNQSVRIQLRNTDKLERLTTRYNQYYQKLEQFYSYIIHDLNTAHHNSLFYTGVEFAKRMRVVLESPLKKGMKISDQSCFKVQVYEKGDQRTYPLPKQKIKINYKIYDEGFNLLDANKEGVPFCFVLGIGEVIKGWELAIPEMSLGEKSLILCHKDFINNSKYIQKNKDQSSSSLYFEIEILDII